MAPRRRRRAPVRGCAANWTAIAPVRGRAPPAEAVAEARRLTDEANRRLAALRSHLLRQRERVALI